VIAFAATAGGAETGVGAVATGAVSAFAVVGPDEGWTELFSPLAAAFVDVLARFDFSELLEAAGLAAFLASFAVDAGWSEN
jgi:hypothetical protein